MADTARLGTSSATLSRVPEVTRLGANAVLSFWLAYILTRPLGANLGDWLAAPKTEQGLGLGVATTSVIFLAAILATVAYLAATRADVIERDTAPLRIAIRRASASCWAISAWSPSGPLCS
ncbi:hypothetical protein A5784_06080 [Mycobacterium sp. 852013-50091_SCH5140682]|uniref:hypothetical protein n=1 Tax=Mycobacterium sp. 852013-50091_SCH5140682 TaxID=1834109 RepID=UPI0007E9EFC5|nr:hypothetical protein [Mycobacterium sp. 852013-50091_SCH5140682]OBC08948.1 hypothetical protein A5784_06080 [Mycobacterium sp. 852013-50091_SCH5140682]